VRTEPKPNARRVKCLQCRKAKPRTSPPKTQLPNHTYHLQRDPFCSASCARAFHGVSIPTSTGLGLE
jgi:hypothetical protein